MRKWLVFHFIFVFSFFEGFCQTPCFTLVDTIGCVPFRTKAVRCPALGGLGVAYNPDTAGSTTFLVPLPGQDTFFHEYKKPGVYYINQAVQNVRGATKRVVVKDTMPPDIVLESCEGKKLKILVKDRNYQWLDVDWGDGNTETLAIGTADLTLEHIYSVYGPKTIIYMVYYDKIFCGPTFKQEVLVPDILPVADVQRLNVEGNMVLVSVQSRLGFDYVLFAKTKSGVIQKRGVLKGNDGVLQFSVGVQDAESFSVATVSSCLDTVFTNYFSIPTTFKAESKEGGIFLSWDNLSTSISSLTIKKGVEVINLAKERATFLDSLVACNREYCYQLQFDYPEQSQSTGEAVKGFSDTVCVVFQNVIQLNSPDSYYVSFEDNEWKLKIKLKDSLSLGELNAFTLNGRTVGVGKSSTLILTSSLEDCYQYSYSDTCGNSSLLIGPVCKLLLTGVSKGFDGRELNWSGFSGFPQVSTYIVRVFGTEGTLLKDTLVGNVQNFIDKSTYGNRSKLLYQVSAVLNLEKRWVSHSNVLEFDLPQKIVIPEAFSPNDDGVNEEYKVLSINVQSIRWMVINRFGQVIFETSDSNKAWDGKVNGKLALSDTYLVQVIAEDTNGEELRMSGAVFLFR